MDRTIAVLLVVSTCLVSACSGDSDASRDAAAGSNPPLTAATLGEQSVRAAADYLAEAPYAAASRDNGRRLAQMCKACHTLGEGGVHMIGPNLFGFFGRAAGSMDGYDYSPALQEADFVWTPRALDAWLKRPAQFLPGNRMSFPGVTGPSDRADVVAYLLEATEPAG